MYSKPAATCGTNTTRNAEPKLNCLERSFRSQRNKKKIHWGVVHIAASHRNFGVMSSLVVYTIDVSPPDGRKIMSKQNFEKIRSTKEKKGKVKFSLDTAFNRDGYRATSSKSSKKREVVAWSISVTTRNFIGRWCPKPCLDELKWLTSVGGSSKEKKMMNDHHRNHIFLIRRENAAVSWPLFHPGGVVWCVHQWRLIMSSLKNNENSNSRQTARCTIFNRGGGRIQRLLQL